MTIDQLLIHSVEVFDGPLTELLDRGRYDTIPSAVRPTIEALPPEYDDGPRNRVIRVGAINFGFELNLDTDEADERIRALGLRPITLRELLCFGIARPEYQRDVPIIGLGTVWPGPDQTPSTIFLYGGEEWRSIHLRRILHCWCSSAHFAVTNN